MRIAASAALLFALTACSTTETKVNPYQQPNALMATEINQRIDQIPYQHREELVQNLLWLAQTGEQTIPALLEGLESGNPKVRSSCCWVLGRLRDRRTVPALQTLVNDQETSVRMEASRSLVLMGDLQQSPKLIEGLDSDRKEVRYMCHEALKTATGHDFGYDHLNSDQQELRFAVLRWRQWWGEYAGDTFFASNYEQEHGLNNLAAPGGETKLQTPDSNDSGSTPQPQTNTEGGTEETNGQENGGSNPGNTIPESSANTGAAVIEEVTIEPAPTTNNPTTTPKPTTEGNSEAPVTTPTGVPTVPPVVPPVQGQPERIEVIEIGSENSTSKPASGASAGNQGSTTEVPVIEVPPATGTSGTGASSTGSSKPGSGSTGPTGNGGN